LSKQIPAPAKESLRNKSFMKHLKILLYVIIFFLTPLLRRGTGGEVFAQTYPVQLITQLIPPYSGYLPDYADPASEKLRIILQFNDFTVPQYNVRLKIEIKGNGFTLLTKQLFNPPPITVQPGVPLLISGTDLAPYLNSNNLDFIGINQSQYEQGKSLPEGYYTLCLKAYDYYQAGNTQISNEGCAQAWFTLSDPPLLNLPFCNTAVIPQTPQNILFQWTPMNMGSPNSAFNTEYDFELWEIRPDSTASPNQVVISTAPIYKTTSQQTLLNYGIIEPPLILYMKYVWRVRAKDISGRDLFKNNGYSQICTFTYGSKDSILGNALTLTVNAQGITHRLGKCTWNTENTFTNYLLQVRKQGTTHWFDYPTNQNTQKVTNLEPNTNYEARVRGENAQIIGLWSSIADFTTQKEPTYNCNDQTFPPDPLQAKPLPADKAMKGLIIQSGQFEITATQITASGAPGWYSGTGYAQVFGVFPMEVQWTTIYIDDNNRHQQGIIQATTKGISAWMQQWDVQQAEENSTYTNGTIDTIYINGNQICIIIHGSSTAQCYPIPPDANVFVIRDEEGNQYTITIHPDPPTVSGPTEYLIPSTDILASNDSMMVTFSPSPAQSFGFDKKEYTAYGPNYELIKLNNGKNYFVPYKSIGESKTDKVIADLQINGFNKNLLSFKTKNGIVVTAAVGNNSKQYNVTVPHNAEAVYAVYNNRKIGKINVISLKPLAKKVVIVPVNNASISVPTLQNELNNMYKQANISWALSAQSNFTYNLGNDGLESPDATLMRKYSTEMRALRDAYKKTDTTYDKNAYYLFVVPDFTTQDMHGYMVRGRAVGFVSPLSSGQERLIAHELAHGAFGLEHTFPLIEKSTTNNLLDYGTGSALTKNQWLEIHSSKFIFNWLDSEEDGAIIDDRKYALETLNKIKTAYQNDKNISKSELTAAKYVFKIYDVFLAGIKYPYIKIVIKPQGNWSSIHPKGNIQEIYEIYTYGETMDGLEVDRNIQVFVPKNMVINMKYFLTSPADRNLLLFVNGYLLDQEMIKSADVVYQSDVWDYWSGIDADFINAITTKNAIYASGNDYIITSNHKSHIGVLNSMTSYLSLLPYLNTTPNVWGFQHRFENGKKAGMDLIAKLNNGTITCRKITVDGKIKIIDTMDIVAHSMGFAYSLGMIEEIQKAQIHVGRFYIIAPENGCSGSVPNNIEEAWQYGSNEDLDPIREQDGIAPQCKVGGIDLFGSKGGRAYPPIIFNNMTI